MFVRTSLIAAAACALLAMFPGSAHAAPKTQTIDRSVFDATPERTASSLRVDGPTAGPLGGAMDVTVRATAPGGLAPEDVAPGVVALVGRECPCTGMVVTAAGPSWSVTALERTAPATLEDATPEDVLALLTVRTASRPT